ncbi:MAG: DnaJ domain-containing protein [Lachnospiraceae bacterium]|nr:DnaJ domain-containing protein [Lachnospiraceae bacterium]
MKDPYETLNISSTATDEEVKRAYREMSKKYHPDSYVNNPLADLAEDKFKEIQEAYKEIMDSRANGGSSNDDRYSYNDGFTGNNTGSYNANQGYNGNPFGGFNQNQYNQNQYRQYGNFYGRDPYRRGDDACDLCCKLWCADTMCECMGGDLCTCF